MSVEFRRATLPNGLNVIAEVDAAAHSAAMGFFVKAGARDEQSQIMGVSHFLEHMMFKGTAARSAEQVDREFDDIGAEHNAFTSAEMTAFWCHCLPEFVPQAEDVLSDILRPALRQADFDAEKKVILEEIAMYADNPFWVLYEKLLEEYYGNHPLSHRVLGTNHSISALQRDQMLEYFQNRYSADNTVVALAGRVHFEEVVERLAAHCGTWQRTNPPQRLHAVDRRAIEFSHTSANVHRHYLLMLCPAPAMNDDRRYAAAILSHILGDAEGSRFHWALIDTGMAEEAVAQYEGKDGLGEYLIYCSCDDANAGEVQRVAMREMDHLVDSLTEDDLERVRSKIATDVTLHAELPAGRMRRLGRVWTYTSSYRSLEDELARINAVMLRDLREVHEAFPIKPVAIGHLTGASQHP
jgi:predicted Zn-dependent peptidase